MEIIKTKSFVLAVNFRGDKNSKKMAIVLPGRLDTKDYSCFNSHLECLAGKGFFAICFDPPGTWESPGEPGLFTTTNYIKAVNELIEYFGNCPTLLLGHSRGGQVAMIVGTSNPNVVGFVSINGSFGAPTPPEKNEIKDGFVIEKRDLPPGTQKTPEQKEFRLFLNYFKDGVQYDPLPGLRNCTKPKLFLYGNKDEFNKPEEVLNIFKSLPEPKMAHELKSNHDYRYFPEVVEEVNKTVGEFLEQNRRYFGS